MHSYLRLFEPSYPRLCLFASSMLDLNLRAFRFIYSFEGFGGFEHLTIFLRLASSLLTILEFSLGLLPTNLVYDLD